MLQLDIDVFTSNLRVTQAYCAQQLNQTPFDMATVLRSINPFIEGQPAFSFPGGDFDMQVAPGIWYRSPVAWAVDPLEPKNEHVIGDLFKFQMSFKNSLSAGNHKVYDGQILVMQFESVTDGVSESVSMGLIDVFDIPPIDTWFYLKESEGKKILFAWIPELLVPYATEAIEVNCVDCLNWFKEWYPREYEAMVQAQPLNI